MNKKLYVLVDSSLSKSQQAVQSAHAVAQFLLEYPDSEWRNNTLVLLKVDNLENWMSQADAYFKEPDFGNKLTAIAILDKPGVFRHLKLV